MPWAPACSAPAGGSGYSSAPLWPGVAIDGLKGVPVLAFARTHGYVAAFLVTGVLLLASIPVLRRIDFPPTV